MKAKRNISKKDKQLESLAVEPSKQPEPQANREDLDIDLNDFPALREVKRTLEKLCCSNPSAIDCEDESLVAYKKTSALLNYVGYADTGLDAEGSEYIEPIGQWVMDCIQLQVDVIRLASKRLFSVCEAKKAAEI
jgi:hypothetical protein